MDTLKEFMNVDELKINPLENKYIIKTDLTTGIDSFTLSGQEGCVSRIMISSKEPLKKLSEQNIISDSAMGTAQAQLSKFSN